MKSPRRQNQLRALAKACGVQLSYRDMDGRIKHASDRSLLAAVRAFGINVSATEDYSNALDELQNKRSRRVVEPVIVAWEGRLSCIRIRISKHLPKNIQAVMQLETGEKLSFLWEDIDQLRVKTTNETSPSVCDVCLPLKKRLPLGYHHLNLMLGKETVDSLIISAPRKAPDAPARARRWGLFCPLYALHSSSSWGAGNFSDFFKLAQWSSSLGGNVIATLPLLPGFYLEHFNPSPYSPVSRLFWNEFFIDVEAIPELGQCPEAVKLLGSNGFKDEISKQRDNQLVDYAGQMQLKRRILEILAECFFHKPDGDPRKNSFEELLARRPNLKGYARFRAVSERLKISWMDWPEKLRAGSIEFLDFDPKIEFYHLYTQFIAYEQLRAVSSRSNEIGQYLYLDLPLGSNPNGYDVWNNQGIFAIGSSVGAPPDPAFPGGQDWGFPPLHPERLRETGYRYVIDIIRHHLQFAGVLRLDHIMGLHRLYWIPAGLTADQGVYIRYDAEEMYAILCLEAWRANATLVGEDLGLVPETVHWSMRRHNIYRSYIAQYEMLAGHENCLDTIPVHAAAAANTHDMHPFAAFWQGTDVRERQECGVLNPERALLETSRRNAGRESLSRCLRERKLVGSQSPSPKEVYRAICRVMASSDAEIMLLGLDDLTGSTQAQNIPGTCDEHPNWRRRIPRSLEEIEADPEIEVFLREIDSLRRRESIGDSRKPGH